MFSFQEILQYANVLLFPILWYIVKLEVRLTKIETMQSAEYQYLVTRNRHTNGKTHLHLEEKES